MKKIVITLIFFAVTGFLVTQNANQKTTQDKVALYREIGIANYWEFNFNLSVQRLNFVLREDSLDHEAFFYRGLSKGNMGSYASAIKDFDKAIKINQSNPDYYFKRAECLLKLHRWEKAVFAFDEAIQKAEEFQKEQNLALMYYEKGLALAEMKSWPSACILFSKAAALGNEQASIHYHDLCENSKYDHN